jgi:hypothetical protein
VLLMHLTFALLVANCAQKIRYPLSEGRSLQESERQRTMADDSVGGERWASRVGRASGLSTASTYFGATSRGGGAASFFGGRGTARSNRMRQGAASLATGSLREQLYRPQRTGRGGSPSSQRDSSSSQRDSSSSCAVEPISDAAIL